MRTRLLLPRASASPRRALAATRSSSARIRVGAGLTAEIGPPAYGCTGKSYPGPERAYRFTGAASQNVFAQIYGLGGDLALFDIDVPSGQACDATSACSAYSDRDPAQGPEAIGFTPQAGRDHYFVVDGAAVASYSLAVSCTPPGGCAPRRGIQVGQKITANTSPANDNVTGSVSAYDCAPGAYGGNEAAWMFTPTVSTTYTVTLANLDANCDLFVLPGNSCGSACLTPTSFSAKTARGNETLAINGVADTTYFIVVDAAAGVSCSFDLSVATP